MEVSQFEQIQSEFMDRAQQAVYCNVATVDLKGRPRSRVTHLIWGGPIGWVITCDYNVRLQDPDGMQFTLFQAPNQEKASSRA